MKLHGFQLNLIIVVIPDLLTESTVYSLHHTIEFGRVRKKHKPFDVLLFAGFFKLAIEFTIPSTCMVFIGKVLCSSKLFQGEGGYSGYQSGGVFWAAETLNPWAFSEHIIFFVSLLSYLDFSFF